MKTVRNAELDESIIDWPVHMQRALDLACNVLTTAPNPRVGCVLVKDREVVAEGWHVASGHAHAEAAALAKASQPVQGATAFVSLEPCAHHGKTGPCSDALIEAGISRVVIAMIDPNPKVAGGGIKKLEAAGIEVICLQDFEASARAINPGFLSRLERGRPFVRMKQAISLDGRTALANGESKWITGSLARTDVQKLRLQSSAVLTGIGTVSADDPSLNVREAELDLSESQLLANKQCLQRQPLRVVLDSTLKISSAAKVLNGAGQALVYTHAEPDADWQQRQAVTIQRLPEQAGESGVNLASVLESLAADYECNEVLLEAGPTLCAAFLKEQLVDELIVYIAPRILGSDSRPMLTIQGIESLASSYDFSIAELSQLGNDIKAILRPAS